MPDDGIVRVLQHMVEKSAATWPAGIIELAGAWKDLPVAEEIRKGIGKDVPREPT